MIRTLWRRMAKKHRYLHQNELFYSLTPQLAVAVAWAMDRLPRSSEAGGYYEFGLFKGYTLWFAEHYTHQWFDEGWMFYGFDSFEGMPDNRVHPHWAPGNYRVSLEEVERHLQANGANMRRIALFKGWFSLDHFDDLAMRNHFLPARLVVIDSDLYESCVPVLAFIRPFLRTGTMVLFDDWHAYEDDPQQGEQRAWSEFLARNPEIRTRMCFDFGIYGRAFEMVEV